jgi:RNA recognition motif-containing protein
MPTKLYVGNLAYAVTNEDLAQLFEQAGKVESAVVVTDKFSGQSRGFGFVEMAEAADATRAVETLNSRVAASVWTRLALRPAVDRAVVAAVETVVVAAEAAVVEAEAGAAIAGRRLAGTDGSHRPLIKV